MKRNDIVRAFDEVKPTKEQADRMYENILNSKKKTSRFEWRNFVPAMAAALVVITVLAGFKALNTADKLPVSLVGFADTAKSFFKGENGKHSALVTSVDSTTNKSNTKTSGTAESDTTAAAAPTTEAQTVKAAKTFKVNDVTYKEVTEELAKDLPVDGAVNEEDVGALIFTVPEEDKTCGGSNIYEYAPVKGRFFTVLEDKDGSYKLFMFEKTEADDVKTYFDIFGITSAEDIARVTVSEGEKTVEVQDIEAVFNELSKAESDIAEYEKTAKAYLKAVPAVEPKTTEARAEEETTEEAAQVTEAAESVDAADDAGANVTETVLKIIKLKIQTVSGLTYETEFYPQIDYISTCKISDDFSELLKTVLSK